MHVVATGGGGRHPRRVVSMRSPALRGLLLLLAVLHTLPAAHHLHDFFARPGLSDAWKGFGALVAVWLFAGGGPRIGRAVACIRRAGPRAIALSRVLLVAAHAVPLVDHLPRAIATAAFGDTWKAAGSLVAIAILSVPPRLVFARLRRRPSAVPGDQRLRQEPPAVDRHEEEELEGKADLGWAEHLHPQREQDVRDH